MVSRFGVHLIQVLERREATLDPKPSSASRRATCCASRSSSEAYREWVAAKPARAAPTSRYREPPQSEAVPGRRLVKHIAAQALRPALPDRRRGHRRASSTRSRRRPGEALVEIGPGLGALTQPLVERCGRLTVIELDRDLAARLRSTAELDVVESDVLKVDFAALAASCGPAPAARRRQPALQHLDADPVPPARRRAPRRRPALHAAEGSGRPHGRRARRPRTTAG